MKSIVVYEQTGELAAAIRRVGGAEMDSIEYASTHEELTICLQKAPTSFVVIQALNEGEVTPIHTLEMCRREFLNARFAVVMDEQHPAHVACYEAGASLVVTCPWKLEPLVRMVRRHFSGLPAKTIMFWKFLHVEI